MWCLLVPYKLQWSITNHKHDVVFFGARYHKRRYLCLCGMRLDLWNIKVLIPFSKHIKMINWYPNYIYSVRIIHLAMASLLFWNLFTRKHWKSIIIHRDPWVCRLSGVICILVLPKYTHMAWVKPTRRSPHQNSEKGVCCSNTPTILVAIIGATFLVLSHPSLLTPIRLNIHIRVLDLQMTRVVVPAQAVLVTCLQIAEPLGSTLIRHRFYAKVSDECLIFVDEGLCYLGYFGYSWLPILNIFITVMLHVREWYGVSKHRLPHRFINSEFGLTTKIIPHHCSLPRETTTGRWIPITNTE